MRKLFWILTGVLTLGLLAQPAFAPAQNAQAPGRSGKISADPAASHQELPASAQSAISAAIGRDQAAYYAVATRNGFRVKNPQSGLAAEFTPQGVQICSGAQASWGLKLKGYGESNNVQPVASAKPEASGNRVEYRRGAMTEWYLKGPAGLEQGFTISKPPVAGKSGTLTLVLALSGNLIATVDEAKTGLSIANGKKTFELRYTGLAAYDAGEHKLQAWLELRGRQLLVRVSAAGAHYPVVVDPYIQYDQVAKLTASSPTTSFFLGYSVRMSADGRTVVAGTPYDTTGSGAGAAYVFVKPASAWASLTESAKLIASDATGYNGLGRSIGVSADGSTVAVAAYSGVYVFVRPSSGWAGQQTQNAKLTVVEGQQESQIYGQVSVSADGATVVAGDVYAVVGTETYRGAAHVFVRPSNGWVNMTQSAKLTASDGQTSDLLGYSVSVSADGSTVAVGAPSDFSLVSTPSPGAAYVFVRPSNGWVNMTQSARLTASDGQTLDRLGYSLRVSADGSTVVAGAPFADISSYIDHGALYVFVKQAGGWADETETAKLTSSDGEDLYVLGTSVDLSASGSIIVAEVPVNTSPYRVNDYGAAYIFVEPPSGWIVANRPQAETAKLAGSAGQYYGSYTLGGYLNNNLSLSADGLTLAAGLLESDLGWGAAYLFSNAIPFDQFQVNRLTYSGERHSTFFMNASFVLGTGNNGLDPGTEPVTLVIGSQVLAIPAGSLALNSSGNYIFTGVIGGIRISAQLRDLGASSYMFNIVGSNANLAGKTNPMTVTLSVGDNRGSAQIKAVGR